MKVVGFTIVRNAIQLDYPVRESILSMLPLCDEVVVAIGRSDDETEAFVRSLHPTKIRILPTVWDDTQRTGGRVLALETDKAFQAIGPDADWCFYLQADEVLHEDFIPIVRQSMERHLSNPRVEGLLFQYRHFYGSYDYVGDSPRWYRREIRIIRNHKDIFSYRDAQGFRIRPNRKLRVVLIPAFIYHYGWVRDPRAMQQKQVAFNRLYFSDEWIETYVGKADTFDYSGIDSLERFTGTHPAVMLPRIARMNWTFDRDLSNNTLSGRYRLKRWLFRLTGWMPGEYRNYRLIR